MNDRVGAEHRPYTLGAAIAPADVAVKRPRT
jgi:hypothetical protein